MKLAVALFTPANLLPSSTKNKNKMVAQELPSKTHSAPHIHSFLLPQTEPLASCFPSTDSTMGFEVKLRRKTHDITITNNC